MWGLEVGEEELEDEWEGGTFRFVLLVPEVSVPSVGSVSEDFFRRDAAFIAASLVTASLMGAGTRTQANVRS